MTLVVDSLGWRNGYYVEAGSAVAYLSDHSYQPGLWDTTTLLGQPDLTPLALLVLT